MPSPPAADYYALLGVPADAEAEELRKAWRQLALRWHPDRAGDVAKATFQRISAAGCAQCDGTRTVEELFSAWLAVPPGVIAGEVLTPSVELPGMVEPVRFRVQLYDQKQVV